MRYNLQSRHVIPVTPWRSTEVGKSAIFEPAVDHELDADLVVVSSHGCGAMPEAMQAVLADWLICCGVEPKATTYGHQAK